MSNDPYIFIAQPDLLAAIDATCEARHITVDQLADEINAVAAWTTPVTGAVLDAMVRGTFVPSDQLADAVAAAVGGDPVALFEPHPDVARLLAGRRLVDDAIGQDGAVRAARRM